MNDDDELKDTGQSGEDQIGGSATDPEILTEEDLKDQATNVGWEYNLKVGRDKIAEDEDALPELQNKDNDK